LAKVLLDLSMTETINNSLDLGQDVLRQLSKIGPTHRKRVEQAGFVVLKSPDIPSILVETAFLSNPKEERLLRNAKHRRRVAKAIYQGIKRYFRRHPVRATAAQADVEYVVRIGDSLSAIAVRYGTTIAHLKSVNRLSRNTIRVGQKLRIPVNDVGG
jgi:N-acetylmuramoyl-L-alanine amidase